MVVGGNSILRLNLRPSLSGKRVPGTVPTKTVAVTNKASAAEAEILAVVLLRIVTAKLHLRNFSEAV